MKIRLSFTDGYRFIPRWTSYGFLTFTTITGVTFSAQRTDDIITWYTTTSNVRYSGTEELLHTHIAACNRGRLYVHALFHHSEGIAHAHFVTEQQRELFLYTTDTMAILNDEGAKVSFSCADNANTALWFIAATVPYLKKTPYLPSCDLGYILSINDGAKQWYLSFGRTIRAHRWDTESSAVVYVPRLQMRFAVNVGTGTPWFFVTYQHREYAIASAHALAEMTAWDVRLVQSE